MVTTSSSAGNFVTTTTYQYDANGSAVEQTLANGDRTTYQYDARDRLSGATVVQGGTTTNTSYIYTADGDFAGETVNGVPTRYLVDEQSPSGYSQTIEQWSVEANGSSVLAASFTYGSGLVPISTTQITYNSNGTVSGAQTGLFLVDGYSGVRQVVDAATGSVLLTNPYDAFGNTVANAGSFKTPIGYQGQWFNSALGQYNMRARMYDPTSGRFTSMDPDAATYYDPQQLMRYGYAGGNPVWRMDPSGRDFLIGGAFDGFSFGFSIASINPHAQGTGQNIAFQIGLGISGALGCQGIAAFNSIMGLPLGIVLGAAVGFYGGFIAGYADALAENPLVSEEQLNETALVSGILGAIQGILAFSYLGGVGRGACFTAGTPLLTPDGTKPIEQFQPGDRVLARDENNPAGPVEAKIVEEVFVYQSQAMYLTVGGRRIGTTSEHPFYVLLRGWTKAAELRTGDVLIGHDGRTSTVQATAGRITR
jgi:RHS repeat-associated protein